VGTIRFAEANADLTKGEIEILGKEPQIRYTNPIERERSNGYRRKCETGKEFQEEDAIFRGWTPNGRASFSHLQHCLFSRFGEVLNDCRSRVWIRRRKVFPRHKSIIWFEVNTLQLPILDSREVVIHGISIVNG
jgi:hypothetical protein